MPVIPKYKVGTIIAIEKEKVMNFFNVYIEKKGDKTESYICKDGSFLILHPGTIEEYVFVEFHCNFLVDPVERSVNFPGMEWLMEFCKQNNAKIKNLRTGTILSSSYGAVLSDIFHSTAWKLAKHSAGHPKDKMRDTNK